MKIIYKLDLQHPMLLGCDFAAMWRMPECWASDRGVVTVWSEFVEGLRSYRVGLKGLRYLCSICTMHLAPQGMCPLEGGQARRGFVPLTRGGSRMAPLCHVLLTAQGCENLPQGNQGKGWIWGYSKTSTCTSSQTPGQQCPETMDTPGHFAFAAFALAH